MKRFWMIIGWLKIFIFNFPHYEFSRKGIVVFPKTGHALHLSNPYGLSKIRDSRVRSDGLETVGASIVSGSTRANRVCVSGTEHKRVVVSNNMRLIPTYMKTILIIGFVLAFGNMCFAIAAGNWFAVAGWCAAFCYSLGDFINRNS